MTTVLETRADWPWIAGRNELVRLVAVNHHDAFSFLREASGSLAGIDVFAKKRGSQDLSWAEILDATHSALEKTGREIASASTKKAVKSARLHHEVYEKSRSEIVDALLSTAHNILKRHPTDGGWLVGYGRRTVGGEMEIIPPTAWEAGTPDWDNWHLAVADGSTFFGARLLNLDEAHQSVWAEVVADLDGGDTNSAVDRAPRPVTPQNKVNAWYKKRVENWPEGTQHPSINDDVEAAHDQFGENVTRDQVRKARNLHAPAEWKKQGRPKSGDD